MKQRLRKISKFFFILAGCLAGLLLALFLLIRVPTVQNWLVSKTTQILEERLGTEVSLSEVDFGLPSYAVLRDLHLSDAQDQTLVHFKAFHLDILDFSLFQYVLYPERVHELHVGTIQLIEPEVSLYRNPRDSTFNFQFLLDSLLSPREASGGGTPIRINISDLRLQGGSFHYADSTASTIDSAFVKRLNFSRMKFDNITLNGGMTVEPQGRIQIDLSRLYTKEAYSGLEINHLSGRIISDTVQTSLSGDSREVRVEQLDLQAGPSFLKAHIDFPSSSLGRVFDRQLDDRFVLNVYQSEIHVSTLEYLTRLPVKLGGKFSLNGELVGTLQDFRGANLLIGVGEQTKFLADAHILDVLVPAQTELMVSVREGLFSSPDLQALMPTLSLSENLMALPTLPFTGSFKGKYRDFGVGLNSHHNEGELVANLDLNLDPALPQPEFNGSLAVREIDFIDMGLGNIIPSPRLNFNAVFGGTGLRWENLVGSLFVQAGPSQYQTYRVDTLTTDLKFNRTKITGGLFARDLNGLANLKLDLNPESQPPRFTAQGTVSQIDLSRYGFYEEPLLVGSEINFSVVGDSLERLRGFMDLQNTQLQLPEKGRKLQVPQLYADLSQPAFDEKKLSVRSDLVYLDLTGKFTLRKASELVQTLFEESQLYFSNEDSLIQAYYAQKKIDTTEVAGRFTLANQDSLNRLFAFMGWPVSLAEQGKVEGDFQFGLTEQITINWEQDSLRYDEYLFKSPTLNLTLLKLANTNSLAVAGGVLVDSMILADKVKFNGLRFDLDGLENTFESTLLGEQANQNNRLQLQISSEFRPDGSIVSTLNPRTSFVQIQGDELRVQEGDRIGMQENAIIYANQEWEFQNLGLMNDTAYMAVNGWISPDSTQTLDIYINDFSLSLVNDLYPLSFVPKGKIHASITLKNLLNDPEITSFSELEAFQLDDFAYGDLIARVKWHQSEGKVRLKTSLWDAPDTTLRVVGFYDLRDTVAPIHFDLFTNAPFPLNYSYPFVKTQLYNIQGSVELDQFTIRGHPRQLIVNGEGHFADAGFGVEYFKTEYAFGGTIEFDNDRIRFPSIKLRDKNGQPANFRGYIYHQGLEQFTFDLQLDSMENFLIMDTEKGENDLFYGTIYASNGIGYITGDLDKLNVQAIAAPGPKSHLKIPITYGSDLAKPDFIRFKGEETLVGKPIETGLKGFDLNLTAIMTEDLQVDLIFDERVGDIIEGRGNGSIQLNINEAGEFSMFGDYFITQGNYLFTSQNIINKKFEVKEGGQISWTGDPYDARLKLDAIYPLYADVRELLNEENPVRAPVNVLMHMEGSLLEPEIALSIELPNLNQNNISDLASYIKSIQYDEQELNKQVFSLMMFNRFAPVGGFLGGDVAGIGVTTSISELLSNQLNYWLSQAINDKVSVNVGTSNFQDVNLLVSAKMFNDRVIIERDGNLISQTENFSIGNLSVIIKLLPNPNLEPRQESSPSELVLEVFNRENLDSKLKTNTNETGIGIFFKKDFDSMKELFSKKK
ncbi:MAG: translocation/assembly module TamB domain-containing protein [Bacteroidota bacterium]